MASKASIRRGGGRTSGTWTKETRPKNLRSGRRKGSKDKVPRSLKMSIVRICQEVVTQDPALIRRAIRNGLKARPPASFPYLQLAAHYLDGRPGVRVEVKGQIAPQMSQAAQQLKMRLQQMAIAIAQAKAQAETEAARPSPWQLPPAAGLPETTNGKVEGS
jgi:hypothetical protein